MKLNISIRNIRYLDSISGNFLPIERSILKKLGARRVPTPALPNSPTDRMPNAPVPVRPPDAQNAQAQWFEPKNASTVCDVIVNGQYAFGRTSPRGVRPPVFAEPAFTVIGNPE